MMAVGRMGAYWWRVLCRACKAAFGFIGWNIKTVVVAIAAFAIGAALRWYLDGWTEMITDAVATLLFALVPALAFGGIALIWFLLREPALMDAELRERLEPLNYDAKLAAKLIAAFRAGEELIRRNRYKHLNDGLEEEYRRWFGQVSELLRGRLPHNELVAFETIAPDNFSLGRQAVETRVGKLRLILLRYAERAPVTEAHSIQEALPSGET